MNNINTDTDLIERYFSNELDAEEKEVLMSRLASEESLKKRFEQERLLVNAIKIQGAANTLAHLKGIERSLTTVPFRRWIYYAAAASVTLFIATWFFLWPTPKQSEDLFAAYFEPAPNLVEPITRGARDVTERMKAFQAYEAAEFDRSVSLFEEILKDGEDAGVYLLLGNACLTQNKNEQAIESLRQALRLSDEYDIEATWYLSLALLRTEQIKEARRIWEQLSSSESPYAEKARTLLAETE